jgi:hypothetical protein
MSESPSNPAQISAADVAPGANRSELIEVADEIKREQAKFAAEPEGVQRARKVLGDIDPERVAKSGYTATEAAALRTLQAHEAAKPVEQPAPTSSRKPKPTPSQRKENTVTEQQSNPAFTDAAVKTLGGQGYAFYVAYADGNLEFIGLFAGKTRTDAAPAARTALAKRQGWDKESAARTELFSLRPNHARVTPSLPVEAAKTDEAPAPAESTDAPQEPATAPTGPTQVEVDGTVVATTEHIDVPIREDGAPASHATTDEIDTALAGKVDDMNAFCNTWQITVERSASGKGMPLVKDYRDAIGQYAAQIKAATNQAQAA